MKLWTGQAAPATYCPGDCVSDGAVTVFATGFWAVGQSAMRQGRDLARGPV